MGVSQAVAFGLIAMVALSTFVSMAAIYQKSQVIYNSALAEFRSNQIASQDTALRIVGVIDSVQDS